MTVSELIEFLKAQPQELQVAYRCYSEQVLLTPGEIYVADLCELRPDGWIQSKRPDMATQQYLLFPGN